MVKLYYASTAIFEEDGVFDNLLEQVNEQRRRKVLRCKNKEDKECSLLAGVLLRKALESLGYSYEQMEFAMTPEKKPIIKNKPDMFFNLSHSGSCAVCLIADGAIGVDVEWTGRGQFAEGKGARLDAIGRKCFSASEYEEYQDAPAERKTEVFLKYWTRKEAYGKAIGKGLAMDFSGMDPKDENYLSFWLVEGYYVSIYAEKGIDRKELELCMMN